jgi:glycine cleavage system H protein|tara:strand:+ start:877 stop:1263 length:387 start_codon:yes stop_codon:yes gene_type:complete
MDFPEDLRYTSTHEWASAAENGVITIGITDFAQDQLGDVVFVELPQLGDQFEQGDPVAVVESVKTASDIYAPTKGTVVEVNSNLEDSPEEINSDPYSSGWIFRLSIDSTNEMSNLLDATAYRLNAVEE